MVRIVATYSFVVVATTLLSVAHASAEPPDGPLIETTCSYDQLRAALQVEDPTLVAVLDENPQAQAKLRAFIALPADQRKQRLQQRLDQNPDWQAKIDEKRSTPEGQEKIQMMQRIAATCQTY
jgi:hemophore-related protein